VKHEKRRGREVCGISFRAGQLTRLDAAGMRLGKGRSRLVQEAVEYVLAQVERPIADAGDAG
jgi:hypothetical protein